MSEQNRFETLMQMFDRCEEAATEEERQSILEEYYVADPELRRLLERSRKIIDLALAGYRGFQLYALTDEELDTLWGEEQAKTLHS